MSSQCIRVLIIEDNPGDARLVREALKEATSPRYEVEWTDLLSKGLACLAQGGIDVLLLDLGLPDSEGLAGLMLIQALAPALPVVVLSGATNEHVAIEAVHAGAQDYLVKGDANPHLLMRAMRYAIERKAAEEARRESEQRLRLAMRAANEAIWEYDPASEVVRWSDTYIKNFGGSKLKDSTQWWVQHIYSGDRDRVCGSFREALEGSGDSWDAEYRSLRGDGVLADVHDRAVIARDTSGTATRVVGAMLDVTSRKRTEAALGESNRKLQQLSRDLLRSQDYERRRIARELHDSTAQLLAALSINLSRLQESGLEPDRRKQVLCEAIELAAACSAEIRTVTYLLHPPLLDEVGLVSALQAYSQGFEQRTGIQLEVKIAADFGRLNRDLEITLFRIVQEGLANIHKHSGSRLAVIRLERDSSEARLVLQDRGHGFSDGTQGGPKGFVRFGVGIPGMRERAEQLGGRLELTSNDLGTRLTVTLPLVHGNEENANPVGG